MRKKTKSELLELEQERIDVGFGTKITSHNTRLITPEGKFNVKLTNQPLSAWLNIYNRLLQMPWHRFGILIFLYFLVANFIFAGIYYMLGTQHLLGIIAHNNTERFWETFFFSAQTITTVGYGRISPVGFATSFVAAVESLVGLLAFALATGLLYGKFSKPVAHIRYSKKALISPYLDTTALMFRIINERSHQLIEVKAEVVLTRLEQNADGQSIRKYYGLKLERNNVNFFPSNWTIVHAITDESPLYGKSPEQLKAEETELLILIKGFDDSFAQTVHSRYSYLTDELVWNARFVNMQETRGHITYVDLARLSDYELVP
jgi:inward rectifier potassium channel